MGNKRIVTLAIFTIFVFPLAGFAINYFFSTDSFISIFRTKHAIGYELLIGGVYGILAGFIAWKIIELKILSPVRNKYQNVISSLKMDMPTIILVSICAGVGEEILFRGVLQSFFGILITSILFVAIHGYLNPLDWRISIYGAYMTLAIIGIGYLFNHLGLTSAMLAHTMIDVILFYKLTNDTPKTAFTEDLSQHSNSSFQTLD